MIEAKNLTKTFGENIAVDDVSFSVEKGEVLGFLGPNGAGKSTTMRMITGFLPPTSGTATIGGSDIIQASLAARQKIGYLPENAPAYPDMTVTGFLDFIAGIRGLSGQIKKRRIEEVLAKCFLKEVRYQTIQTLSKGFKQRVCFAQSIIHDPEYLIMDEPTDGLDPNQKYEVRAMIKEMARDKAIIFSTHILEEVAEVCSRVIIIAGGKIVADDTPMGLKARSPVHGTVCFTARKDPEKDIVTQASTLPGIVRVDIVEESPTDLTIRVFPEDPFSFRPDAAFIDLSEKGYAIETFYVEQGRLDEVFRMVTTDEYSERETL